jgi:hypothetical protein
VENAEPPGPYLALSCASIVSGGALAGLFGTAPVLVRDETSVVASAFDVAARQAGVLSCTWGEIASFSTLQLELLPDAAAEFEDYVLPVIDTQYTIADTVGDRSQYLCAYGQCRFDVLVGTTWIGGFAQPPPGATDGELQERLAPVLAEVAAAVGGMAAPGIAWSGPVGALAAWPPCGDDGGLTAVVRDAFDKPDLYPTGDDASPFDVAVAAREAAATCVLWADDLDLSVRATLVPGGGWAIEELRAEPPIDAIYGAFESADFGDASEGLVACGTPGCAAFVGVGGSLVRISAEPATRDAFVSDVREMILGLGDIQP